MQNPAGKTGVVTGGCRHRPGSGYRAQVPARAGNLRA